MDQESRMVAAGVMLSTFGGALITGALAARDTRLPAWGLLLLTILGIGFVGMGLTIAFPTCIPLNMRSNRWIENELRHATKDPAHRYHRAYWAGSLPKYPEVPDFLHEEAKSYVNKLYELKFKKPWKGVSSYMLLLPLLVVVLFLWFVMRIAR